MLIYNYYLFLMMTNRFQVVARIVELLADEVHWFLLKVNIHHQLSMMMNHQIKLINHLMKLFSHKMKVERYLLQLICRNLHLLS
ncbi:MAG: hypothetical protein WCL14_10030 [Bacteroidota bacterium]